MARFTALRLGLVAAGVMVLTCAWIGSAQAVTYIDSMTLLFNQGNGLSGQAILGLRSDNRTIDILLTNTSTAIPNLPGYDHPSSQVLTTLYFDLGGRDLATGDPRIAGGLAWVADGSVGTGRHNDLQSGDDMSQLWGYGNYKYGDDQAFLSPNFVTTLRAHATAFVEGQNLDGPSNGALSSRNLGGAFQTGLSAINDTIRMEIHLNSDLTTLASILDPNNYLPYIEFGSDWYFCPASSAPPPPPPPDPYIEPVPEPVTLVGLMAGLGSLVAYLRRRAVA